MMMSVAIAYRSFILVVPAIRTISAPTMRAWNFVVTLVTVSRLHETPSIAQYLHQYLCFRTANAPSCLSDSRDTIIERSTN